MENFGFKKVNKEEKPKLVNQVFDSVAFRYDLMNDLMSAGCIDYGKIVLSIGLHLGRTHIF